MAFFPSSLLRSICVKGIFGSSSNYHMLGKWSTRCGASWFNQRGVCTATAKMASKAVLNQDSSPWLMLPPEFESGTTSYKFYSLADNKLQTPCPDDVIRNLRLTCRGSSHGWLALLRPHHDDFFLYNPITRRHIMLPSIMNLPRLPGADDVHPRDVSKLILSCSPDEDEENCLAVMINLTGFGNMLAFCCPGRSKEWTVMFDEKRFGRFYEDCVYSARLKLLFVITNDRKLETWDLGDISSTPKLINIANWNRTRGSFSYSVAKRLKFKCREMEYLVVAGEDLLLVTRYLMQVVGPDGQCYGTFDVRSPDYVAEDGRCNYMTFGFDIWKHDPENRKFKYLDSSSLGDLAIFVGKHSHSVAIQASEFPGVKPGSVYFTDGSYTGSLEGELFGRGGHDIGIYNYKDRTVSPCYYPCDVRSPKLILPAPIWFFPSRTI
ncbi:hypothetical protein CASFOL_026610 [Castilleja foliolosa]|uniref:KIB1-4 beta-propeller domain-containing protein n=1 Tax=Castilleja foliolosa TaxID=1961234 RepID=A0ABD3CID8_9LAMI